MHTVVHTQYFSKTMSSLPRSANDLQNLQNLLTHLLEELPDMGEDSQYPFVNFQIDPAVLKQTHGDVAQALCQTLWATFMDGKLLLSYWHCVCSDLWISGRYQEREATCNSEVPGHDQGA